FFLKHEAAEFRIVLSVFILVEAVKLALAVYTFSFLEMQKSSYRFTPIFNRIMYLSVALQLIAVVFVLYRKSFKLSKKDSRSFLRRLIKPSGRFVRAARSMATVLLTPFLVFLLYLYISYEGLPAATGNYFVWYGFLFFYSLCILTYLNHTSEAPSIQVKLIGGSLVTILSIFCILGFIVGKGFERDYTNEDPQLERHTIVFLPNRDGGYDVKRQPLQFDFDLGQPMQMDAGGVRHVPLKFNFPFYGTTYSDIHVLDGPMVYIGDRIREDGWGGYHPQPVIAPLVTCLDLTAGGGVFLKHQEERITVTWYRIPEFGTSYPNTIQLALASDGLITISYRELSPQGIYRDAQMDVYHTARLRGFHPGISAIAYQPKLTGIHPGGEEARLEPVRFSRDLPFSSRSRSVLFQAYDIAFFQYIHRRTAPIVLVLIVSSLIILSLFPIAFRFNLITPLHELYKAMKEADRGNLDAKVVPRFRDEIGSLGDSFNRMLDSIKKAEGNFRALADNASDGIFILIGESSLNYVNRRACSLTGFKTHELLKRKFIDLLPVEEAELLHPAKQYGAEDSRVPEHRETSLFRRDGAVIPVELSVSNTTWHGLPAQIAIVRDIEDRKKREEEARRRQQELMHMDKLISLGVLVAGVAHDINNPNQGILGHSLLLKEACEDLKSILKESVKDETDLLIGGLDYKEFFESLEQFIRNIESCSRRIDHIVSGLKNFARKEPESVMTEVEINSVVEGSVALLKGYISGHTDRFSMDLDKTVPQTRGDLRRLEQVIVNLIQNACQSLPDRMRSVQVNSRFDEAMQAVLLEVRDEGVGIDEEDLPRITDPFFTRKRDQGGTGLGLYVSSVIVEEHGGKLEFFSTKGTGTVARVTLPLGTNNRLPEESGE
ncbi:MAG TPA: ATP-binding protein, partial [Spirochaetia bacterium]|nr:ATP-binding protein [Spirochaetia bacterium]